MSSIGNRSHIHPANPNIIFHDVGLWGEDITDSHGWALQKLSTIRSSLGHQSVRTGKSVTSVKEVIISSTLFSQLVSFVCLFVCYASYSLLAR